MKFLADMVLVAMAAGMVLYSQVAVPEEDKVRLKRSQIEAMLKADHEKSIEEAGQLVKLSQQLQEELEKSDRHVLSMTAMKKAEEIEKLAKRIRNRMKRF
jgi:flagellar basal body rod protein FlgF